MCVLSHAKENRKIQNIEQTLKIIDLILRNLLENVLFFIYLFIFAALGLDVMNHFRANV